MRNSLIQIGIVASAIWLLSVPVSAKGLTVVKTVTIKIGTHSPVTKVSDHDTKSTGQAKRSVSAKAKSGEVSKTLRVSKQHPSPAKAEYTELPEFKKEVARKIRDNFPDNAREMIAIAMAESGLNCGAINQRDSNNVQAVGLFQINDGRWFNEQDIANLTNCDHNIERAKTKYRNGGLNPWGVYWSGSYKKYLWVADEI